MKNINEIREYVKNNTEEVAEMVFPGLYDADDLTFFYVLYLLKNMDEEEAKNIDLETTEYIITSTYDDPDGEYYGAPGNILDIIYEKGKYIYY